MYSSHWKFHNHSKTYVSKRTIFVVWRWEVWHFPKLRIKVKLLEKEITKLLFRDFEWKSPVFAALLDIRESFGVKFIAKRNMIDDVSEKLSCTIGPSNFYARVVDKWFVSSSLLTNLNLIVKVCVDLQNILTSSLVTENTKRTVTIKVRIKWTNGRPISHAAVYL